MLFSNFLNEGSLEVRSATKHAIITISSVLSSPIEFDRLLQRSLNPSSYEKIKSLIGKGYTESPVSKAPNRHLSNKRLQKSLYKTEGNEETKNPIQRNWHSRKLPPSPITKVKPIEEPTEFENIPTLTGTISNSNDWRSRVDAINSLENIGKKYTEALSYSGKFILVLDSFVKALNDINIKVSLKAVSALEQFVPLFKTNLEQNAHLVLESLATNLCSTNVALKNKSDVLIDLLVETLEATTLIQPFVHVILYGNLRAKPIMIQHLCDILPDIHRQRPSMIARHVYPGTFKLLDDSKMEMKSAVNKLIQTLYGLTGKDLIESAPQNKVPRILEAIRA